ncbi:MAG: hypothetical protein AAFW00_22590 [Bacteroidota bacterium]
MNRIRLAAFSFCLLVVAGPLFQSCLRDRCNMEFTYMQYTPIYMTPQEFERAVEVQAPQSLQHPGKLFTLDNFLLINEVGKGIHIFDNKNPRNPVALSFLNVPGNYDIAYECNFLYLDSSTDLLVFDMTTPETPVLVNRLSNVFPHAIEFNGFVADPNKGIVVSWEREMITQQVNCDEEIPTIWAMNEVDPATVDDNFNNARTVAPSATGQAGSMSRFATLKDHLYVVTPQELKSFDLSNCSAPTAVGETNVDFFGNQAEMVSTLDDMLLVGTNRGMYILNTDVPSDPFILGQFEHVTACDPVMAEGDYAYVTLRNGDGNQCGDNFTNQLDIVDISNPSTPRLLNSFNMVNPHGLSIDAGLLFIADGPAGLKVFDASNPKIVGNNSIAEMGTHFGYDVIAQNGLATMIGKNGIVQYDYTNRENIVEISNIPVESK